MTQEICHEFRAEFRALRQERRWLIVVMLILVGINAYKLIA